LKTRALSIALSAGLVCGIAFADEGEAGAGAGSGAVDAPTPGNVVRMSSRNEEEEKTGVHLFVTANQSVGTGTFVDPNSYGDISTGIIFAPSYAFDFKGIRLMATGRWLFSYEYTLPQNPTGRRYNWSDLQFGLSAPRVFTERHTGVSVSPSIGLSAPISYTSQWNGSVTNLALGAGFSRSFIHDRLTVNYRLGGSHGFFIHPAVIVSTSTGGSSDANGNPIFLCRASDTYCASNGMNTDWTVSNTVSVDFKITEKLSVAASYWLTNTWRYAAADGTDIYTPQAVDSSGNPVANSGMGRTDSVVTSLSANYELTRYVNLSAGTYTTSPPKTMDNQGFRNPFFDTISWASNLTTFYFSVAVRL